MPVAETVSVVIPTHARPDYLRTAVASAIGQSAPPTEVVVVSDVDDDATERLCAELDSAAVPVRFVRNVERGGASGSRNAGARVSKGAWLAFLDDDDYWESEYLERALAESDGVDAVGTWLMMFRDDERTPGLRLRPGLAAADAIAENPGVTGSNILIERSAFDALGGFDEELPVKNDGDFFYRFLREGRTYAVVEQFLVLQRKHASGQLTGRTEFRAAGLEKYLSKHRADMTRADRRHLLLSINRIRYHAARGRATKLGYLLKGVWYSSPRSVMMSWRSRSSRSFWLTKGFSDAR